MNNSVFLRVYPLVLCVLMVGISSSWGQDIDPAIVKAKILSGESFSWEVPTGPTGPAVLLRSDNGTAEVIKRTDNFIYDFEYQSAPDFTGRSEFLVQYYHYLFNQQKVYTTVMIDVVPSLLEARRDIVVLQESDGQTVLDVLANDDTGHGASTIAEVGLVSVGRVNVVNNQLVYTKPVGFTGNTSFSYTIEDESGYSSTGVVSITVFEDSQVGQDLDYITSALVPVDIVLSEAGCTPLSNQFELGQLETTGDHSFLFIPHQSAIGEQEIVFTNAQGSEISVNIDILDDGLSSYAVKDDKIYTAVNADITFDPRQNDFNLDGVVSDFSAELTFDGTQFSYSPPTDFEGVKEFYYKVVDGNKELTGTIEIFIGNYLPSIDRAEFETSKNTAFLMQYDAPIDDYTWSVVTPPYRGKMVLTGIYNGSVCNIGNISGRGLIVYEPNEGATGMDYFTLEYCVDGGPCKEVEFEMLINDGEECGCIGPDCVWPGDADNDGVVDVEDLLAIGYNYGQIGTDRNGDKDWTGQSVTDWAFDQEGRVTNNKFADTNGDGILDYRDVAVLEDQLGAYHNINSEKVLSQKDVPFEYVETSKGPYQAGDVIALDVIVGSEERPVSDLKGLVFSQSFPVDVVDMSSVRFTPSNDWIGMHSPVITVDDQKGSTLNVAMSRTSGVGVFGRGRIGVLQVTIIDEIDGTIVNPDGFSLELAATKAKVANTKAQKYTIQSKPIKLQLAVGDNSLSPSPNVALYPNPSLTDVTFHANGKDIIREIEIFNSVGARMALISGLSAQTYAYEHTLSQGMYTALVTTDKGVSSEKFQVILSR